MINAKQRNYALLMINRKLSGDKRLQAREFVKDRRRTGPDMGRMLDALKQLPDLEPEVVESLRTRLKGPQVMRGRHRVLSSDERELLRADRAAGMKYQALAAKYGIGYATAYDLARSVEVPGMQKPKKLSPAERESLRADRAAGFTYPTLVAKYGISLYAVRATTQGVTVKPQPGYEKPTTAKERTTSVATRQAASVALAKRCEQVGWEIENTTSGIRVQPPNAKPYVIHKSYSDRNALEAVERALNKLGLADAEEALRSDRTGARLRAIEADRKRNAARTQQLTAAQKKQEKGLLLKAAGPYLGEPEEVELDWFIKPHPAPWMRWVWMTPAIAQYLLDHHNIPGGAGKVGTNRPQSEKQIRDYRDTIVSGQWRLTHQGGASDTNGNVQDCQHRLAAIVAASELLGDDLRVPMAYFVGMDPDNFKAIDEGLNRTASQLFAMGGEKNGATLRSALRLLIAHKDGDEGARNRLRLRSTNAQLLDAFSRNPETLRAAATAATSAASKVPMGGGAFTALHYLLYTTNGVDNRFVEAFLHGITHGTKMGTRILLDDDDPRAALRRTLTSFKEKRDGYSVQGMDQFGLGILAWNLMVQGMHKRTLRWVKGTEIPQALICKDGVGAVPPRALDGEVDILVDDDE